MDARNAPAIRAGGGAVVQAPRPARARLATGAGALAALGAAAAYSIVSAGDLRPLAAPLAGLALGLLLLALVLRWPSLVPWPIVLGAGAYFASRHGADGVDGWAAAVGVALLLSAELASWSIEHDARIRTEPALVRRRVLTLAALAAVALLVDFLLLGTTAVDVPTGVLLAAVGMAAAVSAVAVVVRLLRA